MKMDSISKTHALRNAGSRGTGFTLVELLVVVAVILILLGISVKVMNVIGRKTATAKTLYVLEQTRHALDAYYVGVGAYPNTTYVPYDHVIAQGEAGFDAGPTIKGYEKHGLSYYIGFEDRPRAEAWRKFSRTVIGRVAEYPNPPVTKVGFNPVESTNAVESIRDGWNRDIIYNPNANSDGYKIYSLGPDAGDPADDVGLEENE